MTQRGQRVTVDCMDLNTGTSYRLYNVLVADPLPDNRSNLIAYWPDPRHLIRTTLGAIQTDCLVLEYLASGTADDDEDDDEEELRFCFSQPLRRVAIKTSSLQRAMRRSESPADEVAAMRVLGNGQHPHVLGYLEVFWLPRDTAIEGETTINVVMECLQGGDLFQLQANRQQEGAPGLSEEWSRTIFKQIMAGLRYMHERGVCHRDLSPENVVFHGDCLVIDFGLALCVPYMDEQGEIVAVRDGATRCPFRPRLPAGKRAHMAPEVVQQRVFDGEASDVFAAGTILLGMLSGVRFVHGMDDWTELHAPGYIESLIEQVNPTVSRDCVDLVRAMLQVEPEARITLADIAQHPWLTYSFKKASDARQPF